MSGDDGFGGLVRDVKMALRSLRRRPTFALVGAVTVALGIGANSAVFTLVSAHFLKPLPYGEPEGLALLWETRRNSDEVNTVAPANYFAWREQAGSFSSLAAFNVSSAVLTGSTSAERVTGSVVTPNFFDVLGVTPLLGTGFDEASTLAADGRVVILGYGLWVRRFGGDRGIVGQTIRVDGQPHLVQGVLPRDYRQPERSLSWQTAEIWRPLILDGQEDNFGRYLRTVGRLAPGVSLEQAREEMRAMAARMEDEYPEGNAGRNILVYSLDEYLLGDARPVLLILLAAGIAVLLLVSANVANLTLARGQERSREFALRAALGSGRRRLVRLVLVESVVLAGLGAGVGAALLFLGRGPLQAVQTRFFSNLVDARVDLTVLAGTAGIALLAGILAGIPQAVWASALDLRSALGQGGARAGSRMHRTRRGLVVGQVGIATALVVLALLLSRSFASLVSSPLGLDSSDVLTFSVSMEPGRYPGVPDREAYLRSVWTGLESIPGVSGVALASDLPFTTENRSTSFDLAGIPTDPENPPTSEYRTVSPEYFGLMGIPVLAGTLPVDGWTASEGEVPVAVNERFAALHFPGAQPQEAVGRGFSSRQEPVTSYRIVAVVGNVVDNGFAAQPEAMFYNSWGDSPQRSVYFLARSRGEVQELIPRVREAVGGLDPDIPLTNLRSMEALLAETVVRPRAAYLIGWVFAVIALLVAAAGIYGVLSYMVELRTREIGIRASLGASREQLLGLVLGESGRLLALGLLAGVVLAFLSAQRLSGLLFGVRPADPVSLLAAVVVLATVGMLAAWLPARRALRVDPMKALRAD